MDSHYIATIVIMDLFLESEKLWGGMGVETVLGSGGVESCGRAEYCGGGRIERGGRIR